MDLAGSWRFLEDFGEIHRRRERRQDRVVSIGCELGNDCLVNVKLEEVAEWGDQHVVVIHKLRKAMVVHEQCSTFDDFPILQSLNSIIANVLQEINNELGSLLYLVC
jgi:hypothetical protein